MSRPLVVGSLFAGIGGFDLGAEWCGWRTAWFSEIDPYASAVLAKHWPGVPNHGDITAIDFTTVEPVDVLCGGFPCQDISNAGKREGIDGERSGLWREYARAIRELRPRYVVVENVAALTHRGLERVLGDLAALGYDAEWEVLSAADVGAPHLRERLWLVAYPDEFGSQGRPLARGVQDVGKPRHQSARSGASGSERRGAAVAYPERGRFPGGFLQCAGATAVELAPIHRDRHGRVFGQAWWPEPQLGLLADGLPNRVVESALRGLGNAVVPRNAQILFRAIQAAEAARAESELIDDAA